MKSWRITNGNIDVTIEADTKQEALEDFKREYPDESRNAVTIKEVIG